MNIKRIQYLCNQNKMKTTSKESGVSGCFTTHVSHLQAINRGIKNKKMPMCENCVYSLHIDPKQVHLQNKQYSLRGLTCTCATVCASLCLNLCFLFSSPQGEGRGATEPFLRHAPRGPGGSSYHHHPQQTGHRGGLRPPPARG